MERRRTRAESVSDEEENCDRRVNLRKRKLAKYVEDNDENEEEEGESEGDQEDIQQPGPSTQNNPNHSPLNGPLAVTCGNKEGILDVEKLDRGQECIECEGRLFNPPAFEEFGGKGSSKKWKASILHDHKPLQCLFEQGYLTTKGFKRRARVSTKRKKNPSDSSSESSSEESETEYEEESEEDEDEEWLPSNVEFAEEKEEESVGVENVVEVVDLCADDSKEEEDEMDTGGMDDNDTPSRAENERFFKEREAKMYISAAKKSALEKEAKVTIKRLLVVKSDCYTKKHSPKDSQDEDEEERQHNGQTIGETAAAHPDPSQMPDPSIIGGEEEDNEGEFSQSTERKENEQKKTPSESLNSPAPPSLPATLSQDIQPETEDIASPSSPSANHSSSLVLIDTETSSDTDIQGGEGGPEMQGCHLEVPESQVSPSFSTRNVGNDSTAPTLTNGREQSTQTVCDGPPTESLSALVECKYENMDAINYFQEAVALQVMKPEIRITQTNEASVSTPSSDMVEAPPSGPSSLDAMELDQLRREKMKMQIKVLRLQEKYYIQLMHENGSLKPDCSTVD